MKAQAFFVFCLALSCVASAVAYAVMSNRSKSNVVPPVADKSLPVTYTVPTQPRPTKPKPNTAAPQKQQNKVVVVPTYIDTPYWRDRWMWENPPYHDPYWWERRACGCYPAFNPVCKGNRSWRNNCYAECDNVFDATTCFDPKVDAFVI